MNLSFRVQIFTDGCCQRNPGGRSGSAAIVRFQDGSEQQVTRGFLSSTNNRAEMWAVLLGLQLVKQPSQITIFSDSLIVIRGIEPRRTRKGKLRLPKANLDLWKLIQDELRGHSIKAQWVKGHAGHPENERCDELAMWASRESKLYRDDGYEDRCADQPEIDLISIFS